MRQSRINAWILLATPNESKPLSYILGMADGLNKAIPELDELRDSLGWLLSADLIVSNEGTFQRTEQGRGLLAACEVDGENAFQLWDRVESTLAKMSFESAAPYDLSAEELDDAYNEYRRRISAVYEKLDSRDT